MHDYQRAFIKLAMHREVLRFGSFTLKSGRQSPYFFNAGLFRDGLSMSALGNCYAEAIHRLIQISARFAGNERLRRMIAALSLQSLRYSKLGLASVERRRRSARLWKQAARALERGDLEQMLVLARQRSEESAEEAARRLEPADND